VRISLVYLSLVYLAFSPDDLWLFTTGVSLPLVHVRLKPNPTPYTLLPTHYTLHPTLYTEHLSLYTLYALRPTPLALHPIQVHRQAAVPV